MKLLKMILLIYSSSALAFGWKFTFFKKNIKNIKNYGTYKSWSDGSLATTCDEYRNPSSGSYTGATGDGIYRISLNSIPTDVYCLM